MKALGAFVVTVTMVGLPLVAAAGGGQAQGTQQTGQTGQSGYTGQQAGQTGDRQQTGQTGDRQDQTGQQTGLTGQQQTAQAGTINADSIIGSRVRDSQGQNMGTVSRLMVNPGDGRIDSAVIATGGFLGIGRDHVQVPWQNLQVQRDGRDVVVTMDRQVLEQAPVASDDGLLDTPAASPRMGDGDRDRTLHGPATQPGGATGTGVQQHQAPSGQQTR